MSTDATVACPKLRHGHQADRIAGRAAARGDARWVRAVHGAADAEVVKLAAKISIRPLWVSWCQIYSHIDLEKVLDIVGLSWCTYYRKADRAAA